VEDFGEGGGDGGVVGVGVHDVFHVGPPFFDDGGLGEGGGDVVGSLGSRWGMSEGFAKEGRNKAALTERGIINRCCRPSFAVKWVDAI
jgi:hypothetical protein